MRGIRITYYSLKFTIKEWKKTTHNKYALMRSHQHHKRQQQQKKTEKKEPTQQKCEQLIEIVSAYEVIFSLNESRRIATYLLVD